MQHLASMAERRPLRSLYNLCDSQKQVSTGKLREYLDHAGDALAGYAATLRHEFDMLTAAAPAAPAVQAEQEPVAQKILDLILAECKYWHCRDEARRGGFAALYAKAKEVADAAPPAHPGAPRCQCCGYLVTESEHRGCLRSSSPSPDAALVEALERARQFIRNGIALGFIRMPDADTPDPAHETLPRIDAALSTYRAALAGKGGE